MKISTEFSKHASEYESHNVIQNRVIEKLLNDLSYKPKQILDLGCGSGALCEQISWKYQHFVGADFAPGMLELHPKSKKIEAIYGDFNDKRLFENLSTYEFEHIFSASALQWAEDLASVFMQIKNLNRPFSLAIFTAGTFKTLNETASLEPLLRSKEIIESINEKTLKAELELVRYTLKFKSVREMFRYIKKSGVSGSRNLLSLKEMKKLMKEYPLDYLEFEVLFLKNQY